MTFDRTLVAEIRPDEVPWIDAPGSSPGSGIRVRPQLVERTAYDELIQTASARHDVDARLVKAVIQVESSFQPRARSSKGAMGLMQLMPATARRYQVRNVFDPRVNIETGTRHLRTLLREFELPLALAAYNAGEAAVRRFGGIPPYSETQAYVAKILDLLQ
jgi:soluble lytic murein transglycosylase-like protein